MKKILIILVIIFSFIVATAFSNIQVSLSPVTISFNGINSSSELPILNYKNHTYVPFRYISDKLDAEIHYDGTAKQISVSYLDDRPLKSAVNSTISHGPFELTIFSEKKVYSEDDVIRVWASFKNTGEEATIYSGDPLYIFNIENQSDHKKYEILGLSLEPHTFNTNDEYVRNMHLNKLGGSQEPYQNLALPVGNYKLGVEARFKEHPNSPTVQIETQIIIKVEQ